MPCGISSMLVQVTVVPAFTVRICGPKLKLSIDTMLVEPSARANSTLAARSDPTGAPSTVAAMTGRNIFILLSLERRVDNRETLPVFLLARKPGRTDRAPVQLKVCPSQLSLRRFAGAMLCILENAAALAAKVEAEMRVRARATILMSFVIALLLR